jgi:hypothetical protein
MHQVIACELVTDDIEEVSLQTISRLPFSIKFRFAHVEQYIINFEVACSLDATGAVLRDSLMERLCQLLAEMITERASLLIDQRPPDKANFYRQVSHYTLNILSEYAVLPVQHSALTLRLDDKAMNQLYTRTSVFPLPALVVFIPAPSGCSNRSNADTTQQAQSCCSIHQHC